MSKIQLMKNGAGYDAVVDGIVRGRVVEHGNKAVFEGVVIQLDPKGDVLVFDSVRLSFRIPGGKVEVALTKAYAKAQAQAIRSRARDFAARVREAEAKRPTRPENIATELIKSL